MGHSWFETRYASMRFFRLASTRKFSKTDGCLKMTVCKRSKNKKPKFFEKADVVAAHSCMKPYS